MKLYEPLIFLNKYLYNKIVIFIDFFNIFFRARCYAQWWSGRKGKYDDHTWFNDAIINIVYITTIEGSLTDSTNGRDQQTFPRQIQPPFLCVSF